MLDGKHTSENIAAAICQVYEVEYEQALQDVENILLEMLNNNLLNESLAPQVIG